MFNRQIFYLFPYLLLSRLASAPVMESPPENRTVRDGRDETFSCKAGGAPTPNITWIFNGKFHLRVIIKIVVVWKS